MSSDNRVLVVQIESLRKHENADTLSIVDVFGGYPCIVRTGEFQVGDLAAYISVDMLVPDRLEFAFLRRNLPAAIWTGSRTREPAIAATSARHWPW